MEQIHRYTKDFMVTGGQTVRERPSIPTIEEMKLRLSLEFEELKEKAEAMGLKGTFAHIASKVIDEVESEALSVERLEDLSYEGLLKSVDTNIVDLVEVFDAALDQRVVAAGTDLAFGFQHIMEPGDIAVYHSNMSKFDDTPDDIHQTVMKYRNKGIDANWKESNGRFVTIDKGNNDKILKSYTYVPVDLKPIIENAQ